MIFDNETMFADDLAYGGSPSVVDMGMTYPGPGRKIRIYVQGNGSLAGATGLTITDGATNSASDSLMSITASAAELNAGIVFTLPNTHARYVKIVLAGTPSAGAWTAGVVLDDEQTNV